MGRGLNKSTWPKPNKAIEAALGRFIIAWNVLEQQMDFGIHEMTGLDHDLAGCVTANLGTKAKLDMYQALAHCMGDVIGRPMVAEINKLCGDTSNASGELRNFIIHGQPFQLELKRGRREIWARFSARQGGLRGSFVRWNGKHIDGQVRTVKLLVERWEATRAKAIQPLRVFDRATVEMKEDAGD
jgi:hypothetical protein